MQIYGTVVEQAKIRPDGTTWVKVRIPSIHGAANITEYRGSQKRHTRVPDDRLPQYQSIMTTQLLNIGETVVLSSMKESREDWIIIGRMGSMINGNTTLKDTWEV